MTTAKVETTNELPSSPHFDLSSLSVFLASTRIWAQDQKNKQAAGVFPELHQAGKIALFLLYQAMEYAAIHEHRATQ